MTKKFENKILILGIMLIMFVGFFSVTNPAQAATLGLTLPGSTSITPNQAFQLKVTTSDKKSGIEITVMATVSWVNLGNFGKCTTGQDGSCSVGITPTQTGSFNIGATATGYTATATASPIVVSNTNSTPSLSVSANPNSIQKGGKSTITATVSDKKNGITVNFAGVVSGLSDTKCTTNTNGSCSVVFEPTGMAFQTSATINMIATATGYNQGQASVSYTVPSPPPPEGALGQAIGDLDCLSPPFSIDVPNCIVRGAYPVFFQLPAFILTTTANLFNSMLALTISSQLYTQSAFISEAWKIVRDISNIFFILILLYAAIQIILDIGHGTKKVISQVIIMAMLINFSLFFTQVVIDSSNVLALIFYNKIAVKGADNATIPYQPNFNSGVPEKDMGGAIASGFDPAKFMRKEMFEDHNMVLPDGTTRPVAKPGASFYLAIIFVSCAVFLYAAYAFFVAAFSFIGRLIELWVLIIFSPFAFMSSALPELEKIEGIGWKSWVHKLISTAFMAPIFMFFMYVISRIISADIFSGMQNSSGSVISDILSIVIPAIVSLVLLMKAVDYAKKGGGQFGSAVMSVGKMVGGLALGAATGGAALAATGTLGKASSWIAGKEGLKEAAVKGGMGGWAAKMALKASNYGANASFDVRKSPLGGLAAKAGLNLEKGTGYLGLAGKDTEGGYKGTVKRKQAKEEAEKEKFKTTMSDDEVKEWAKNNNKINPETGKLYASANELNAQRLKSYSENLGKTGLMYGLSEGAVRVALKVSGKEATEEEITKWAQRVKIGIGTAAVAGLTGGLGAIPALGAAAMTGGGMYSTKDARKGAAKTIGKEAKKLADSAEQIDRQKKEIGIYDSALKKVEGALAETNQGKTGNDVVSFGDYIKRELSKVEMTLEEQKDEEQEIKTRLTALKNKRAENEANGVVETFSNLDEQIKNFQTQMNTLRMARMKTMEEKETLTTAQRAPEKISRIKKSIHDIEDSAKGHTQETKSKEIPHPPAGGGGGHGNEPHAPAADHGGGNDSHHSK
jgi:hypothetical protein